jgi:hypothetical protein
MVITFCALLQYREKYGKVALKNYNLMSAINVFMMAVRASVNIRSLGDRRLWQMTKS